MEILKIRYKDVNLNKDIKDPKIIRILKSNTTTIWKSSFKITEVTLAQFSNLVT